MFKIESGKRFEDVKEWEYAGIITSVHCILPIGIALVVHFFLIENKTSWRNLLLWPIPPVSRAVSFYYDLQIFKCNMNKMDFREAIAQLQDKLHDNLAFVNISVVIEAAVESSFQFWFQTIYLMPSLFLSVMGVGQEYDWKDLFNWRMFSVVLSFGTFSWTFCTIK